MWTHAFIEDMWTHAFIEDMWTHAFIEVSAWFESRPFSHANTNTNTHTHTHFKHSMYVPEECFLCQGPSPTQTHSTHTHTHTHTRIPSTQCIYLRNIVRVKALLPRFIFIPKFLDTIHGHLCVCMHHEKHLNMRMIFESESEKKKIILSLSLSLTCKQRKYARRSWFRRCEFSY